MWLLILLLLAPPALGAAAQADSSLPADGVAAVGFTVSDLDRSVEFFTQVLGFELEEVTEIEGDAWEHLLSVFPLRARVARLRLGDERIVLTDFLAPEGRPYPVDSRSNDAWFQHIAIITSDMERAYRHLRAHDVTHISSGPQLLPAWNPNAGGIRAFYFRDPDGHPLEILEFPVGKGDPKWQRLAAAAEPPLFLGIDHTAIAVADTERSLAFYRGVLGFEVAGESENWGPEQERLNAMFGARLRITALRLAGGPGVELLEYLAPGDGRPMPPDERASDLFHWQTTVSTRLLDRLGTAVRASGHPWVSPGPVDVPDELEFDLGLLVRDPDGHVLELVQP